MSSGLLVIPGVSTLPCLPLMLSLKTIILKYFLVCVFLISPCCVHRDRRPDQTVSVVPSPRFVLFVFSSLWFVPVFCPSRQASPLAASPHARGSREFTPPFAALPSRGSRDFMPAVRGSSRRRSRLSHPAVRGSSRRRSRLSDPAVRGSWRRRSRLCHPAVRGSSRRRLRIIQPSVPRGWRLHPWLTLAHRPASDSMPAGLPLTQCPPACLWLNARRPASDLARQECRWLKFAGLPLTQARRIAADSSSPDCRWLMPLVVGREGQLTTSLFHAAIRGPPVFHGLLLRGESQPAVRGSLGPQPAEAPSSPPAPAVEWSSQPAAAVIVKPADHGIPSRPLPYWQASRPWP